MAERSIERGLADRLVGAVEQLRGSVPIDLERLADALGVSEITRTKMVEDGRTTWSAGRPKIELRTDRAAPRSRFTLAHEIGHILIARDESVARRTHALERDDVEKLCDWIAASILMPRSWIVSYSRRDRYTLSLLRLIAHKAEVSLAAAAVRLAEVSDRTCVLLRWQRAPSRWVVIGQAAVPREYSGGLQATPETSATFDGLPSRHDLWREITLEDDGRCLSATAHVDRSGATCMTLLTSLVPTE
jgi:Zn-dependent peptidase ImmA (M78 family)